jgi:hypothetical protein
MVKMNHVRRNRGGEKIEQFSAMEVIIGRAEVALARVCQRLSRKLASVVPSAEDYGVRPHSHAAHRVLESEAMEDSRRVGAYLDARANLAQFGGLLENANIEPGTSQRQRRRQPADPCSDYDDSHR